jgi:hypothetical protein
MRPAPHIPHPSYIVEERIEEIMRQDIRFAIDPLGPSKFRLRPVEGRGNFVVSVGSEQTCSCHDAELCSHILYVMIRYFDVPKDNDILWQTALTDREIDLVLDGGIKRRPAPRKQPVYTTKSGKRKVKRLPITDEDVCPICYDSFTDCDKCKIAWCRMGCGGNFHRNCVKSWIDARHAHGDAPTCPICREPLDMIGVQPPPKKPINARPALSVSEIQELQNREIGPDDYHLLLKLDEAPHTTQTMRRVRPVKQNQRIRAANQIIANSALEVTGTGMRGGMTQELPKVKTPAPVKKRAAVPQAEFVGEITGTGACTCEHHQRQPASIGTAVKAAGSRPGVPPRLDRPKMTRPSGETGEFGLFVRSFDR